MLLVTPTTEAMQRTRRVHVNGRDYTLAEYVGQAPKRGTYIDGGETDDNGQPQAFLVMQPPGATTPAHFHEPNQFQVFVAGRGRIGAFPAVPLTVQYANGHTPYGPIVAFDEGVTYFTLRQRWDPGAKYLPAQRDKLVAGRQRQRVKGGLTVASDAERTARAEPSVETVFEPEADGLAGWLHRLGAGQSVALPSPARGGGQYLIVAGGDLVLAGRALPGLSTVFVSHEEGACAAVAGDTGLDLLVLQFPRLAAAAAA